MGGGRACGAPWGVWGLRLFFETAPPGRPRAGERQVPGKPRFGYSHVYGAPGLSGVAILERE